VVVIQLEVVAVVAQQEVTPAQVVLKMEEDLQAAAVVVQIMGHRLSNHPQVLVEELLLA
jgi:hypothetical protein